MYKKSMLQAWGRFLWGGGLVLVPQLVHADISGKAFRDFNVNGAFDNSAAFHEVGVAGITVKAFDAAGVQAATATSAEDGSYTLAGLNSGADYRLEFSWSENWLKEGAAGGTSVQFVKDGSTNANLALGNPAQTIAPGSVPQVATAVYSGSIHYGDEFALVKLPESSGSVSSTDLTSYMSPAPTVLAKENQVGSIWGMAHDRTRQRLLAGAFVKRYARLAGNPTTIYSIPDNSGTPSVWVTLDAARADPHGASPNWSQDFTVISSVGKDGLGDVDIAEDGSEVYTVDLKTREFVHIPVNTDGDAGTPVKVALPTSLPNCADGNDVRPMGLGVRDGKVYVGLVCSAESTVSGLPIASSAARKGDPGKLRGYVYVWDGANSFASVLDFPLNYTRGCLNNGGMGNCSSVGNAAWQAWTPAYPFSDLSSTYGYGYPQPMIADIDFTSDGGMVLGLADRFGHMDGAYAVEPPSGSFSGSQLTVAGDVLRACKVGPAWVMEKLISGNAACSTTGKGYDANLQKTIDEYYFEDDMGTIAPGNHADIGEGGVSVLQGSDTVIASVMDPARNAPWNDPVTGQDPWESQGLHWYNDKTGALEKSFLLVDNGQPGDQPLWGKGNGLGDVEMLYPPAPIEIGNRVWLDSDGDGVQDADESGIPNVPVQLLSGGTVLATVTTAADGSYYFSNASGVDSASVKYGLSQLQPNTAYTLHFPATVTVGGKSYNLTTAKAGGNSLIDSDAVASGDVAVTAADIPMAGANNHSFDVGYAELKVDMALTKTVAPSAAKRGGTVVYTLTVTNTGGSVATGVKVTDKLPDTLTFVSHDGVSPGVYDAMTGEWDVGAVEMGAANAVTLHIMATLN